MRLRKAERLDLLPDAGQTLSPRQDFDRFEDNLAVSVIDVEILGLAHPIDDFLGDGHLILKGAFGQHEPRIMENNDCVK
jgi:hypothetical protein